MVNINMFEVIVIIVDNILKNLIGTLEKRLLLSAKEIKALWPVHITS